MSAPASYGATSGATQQAVVTEKFVADRMDPSSVSLDVGTAVTVVSTQGQWANVKTAAGKAGVIPLACLKMQGEDLAGASSAQALLSTASVVRGTRPPPAGVFFRGDLTSQAPFLSRAEQFAPFACEFVGTFILTFTLACCSLGDYSALSPVVVGCLLMVLLYALGPVSGANLNPAVTLTLWFLGKLRWPLVFGYLLAQFCAALLAGCAIFATFKTGVVVGPLAPYGWATTGLCEIIFTALLCLVFVSCSPSVKDTGSEGKQFYGLAIGGVFVAGGCACSTIATVMFNPALAISLDVAYFGDGILNGFVFAFYEVIGALVAFILVKTLGKDEQNATLGALGALAEPSELKARCLSELIGTFTIVFVVGLNVITSSKVTAFSAGAALMSLMYALADISGGHFNPAVTLAVFLAGRKACPGSDATIYVAMQLFAAIVAGFLLTFVHESGATNGEIFGLMPKADFTWTNVFVAEVVFTSFLTWVFLAVSTVSQAYPGKTALTAPPRQNLYFALAVGACIIGAGLAAGDVSGGIVNPAISVGLSVEMSTVVTDAPVTTSTAPTAAAQYWWQYIQQLLTGYDGTHYVPRFVNFVWFSLFELAGGVLGACVFHATHPHEYYAKNALPS